MPQINIKASEIIINNSNNNNSKKEYTTQKINLLRQTISQNQMYASTQCPPANTPLHL
jgi:hypothetical protein